MLLCVQSRFTVMSMQPCMLLSAVTCAGSVMCALGKHHPCEMHQVRSSDWNHPTIHAGCTRHDQAGHVSGLCQVYTCAMSVQVAYWCYKLLAQAQMLPRCL
jgi:hypothetical protein